MDAIKVLAHLSNLDLIEEGRYAGIYYFSQMLPIIYGCYQCDY